MNISKPRSGSSRSYKAIGLLFIVGVVATHGFFFWHVRNRIARGDPDFTVFYTAARILREGRGAQLYDSRVQQAVQRQFTSNPLIRRGPLPFIHPPFEAVAFVPLTFLPYPVAFVVWDLVNLGMLVGVALILRKSSSVLRRIPLWVLILAFLAFFPVFATFHQGQDSILLLLLLALAFRGLKRGSDFAAGCWFGFGMFKYHLILALVLILIFWKGRKLALGFIAVVSFLFTISLALVGWDGLLQYPGYAWRIVSVPSFGGIPLRQLPNLLGLLGGWPSSGGTGWIVRVVALISAVALLIAVAGLRKFTEDRRVFELCFACAVIASVLAGYSTNTYDLSLLIVPLVLVADFVAEDRLEWNIFLPVIPVLVSPLWFFLWLRWERINVMAFFLVWWLFAIRGEIVRTRPVEDTAALSTV
ncbi:MAG TPA: glycosyltransferase family 87 protein [Candidatus Sulfotelmatobacter sp.]|nr:glycosyltransferase family 87 protein [Candidatus Sulfotelmatobacter sp.]